MALPKQLQTQVKQSKDIEAQIKKELEEQTGPDPTQAEIDSLLDEVQASETEPKTQPEKASVTELRPASEVERTDWKQKYSVLQGKYDAEVPRMAQDLREANARIAKFEEKLTELATPKTQAVESSQDVFTKEEIEDYGEDLLDVIGRKAEQVANQKFMPVISGLRQEVAKLELRLGETGQKIAKQETNEVFALLDKEVKDWRTLNTDAAFNDWLDAIDPFTGQTRKNLMLTAFEAKNAPRVKAFFEGFLKENAAVTPASAEAPSAQGGAMTSRLDLGDYVAPGTPKSGGQAGAPKEKRIWSSKEVGRFYSDIQKGHYKTRPEDKARIEADIVAATTEGRIRN
jgi:hypothetical protein